MNKKISLFLVVILILIIFSGCKNSSNNISSNNFSSDEFMSSSEITNSNVISEENILSQANSNVEVTEKNEMITSSNSSSNTTDSKDINYVSSATKVEQRKKVCALTFDDGPSDITPQILDILEKYNCTASFFVVGNNIQDEDIPLLKRAYEMGCTIENHTWSHRVLTQLSVEEIVNEYTSVQEKVYSIVGEYPLFFRATGLIVNPTVYDAIPLTFVAGTSGSNDWDVNLSSAMKLNGILKTAKDGQIFLLHDSKGNNSIVEALDKALPMLISQGYEFVNIRELFNKQNQELTPNSQKSWSNVPYFIKD